MEVVDLAGLSGAGYGGKAAGLARLIGLGAAVPPGFAVSASDLSPADWPAATREAFEARCADLLDHGPVAVRSSAIGEDGAERSFAGQFETVLGVSDVAGAWEAAARCVASGGAERVLAYAGLSAPVQVGTIVQRMVPARAAGVLFTVDPAGADPGLVVEAVAGTGEKLVGGRVAPERWRAYRAGTGAIEVHPDPAGRPGAALTASEVAKIAAEAWKLAGAWGADLDLEWALDEQGRVHWLQARPITARKPWAPPDIVRSVPDAEDGPVTVWANWNVRETMPDPMAPLTWSIWSESIMPALTRDVLGLPEGSIAAAKGTPLDLVNGRVYFNMNAMLASPIMRRGGLERLLSFIDERAARTSAGLVASGVLRGRRLPGHPLEHARSLLGTSLGGFRRMRKVLSPVSTLAGLERSASLTVAGPPVADLSDAGLLEALGLMASPQAGELRDGVAMANAAFFMWLAADRAFAPWPAARRLLAAGVDNNPTTAISVAIDDLAGAAPAAVSANASLDALRALGPADPEVASWLERLAAFLRDFGQRGPREFDLLAPRWADEPGAVLELVRARLASPQRQHVRDRLRALRAERDREVAAALAQAPVWRRPLMRMLAGAVPYFMPLREAPKHHAMRVFHRIRQAAQELGLRLVAAGRLAEPADVFFLEKGEVAILLAGEPLAADPAALVAGRRAAYEAYRGRRAPSFVRSDGVPVPEDAPPPSVDGVLRGVGIGTGQGAGPVVVLAEPDPARFRDGAVLVVEFADPGWTPLFPRAAAIVMEVGGEMCHAAVIARELGIPAVFGVPGATRLLFDGQEVRVDGIAGTVARVSGDAAEGARKA
ncbi:MAG: hypothetical protein FJZ01_01385 [Candidatus Sericytochromatia bacterium]|nr:hypothetical protein [Candidatus Tanganyikabacteria bacterium]